MIVATEGKYILRAYAWAFQKHSPYLDFFNFYLQEFNEKGAWDAIKSKYEARPQVCPDLSGMPIEFANCFTAFLALFAGICLAVVIMILECSKIEGLEKLFSQNNGLYPEKLDASMMSSEAMKKTIDNQTDIIVNLQKQLMYFKNVPRL